jgi:ATP-dependent DNA helicase HFM1/MER3
MANLPTQLQITRQFTNGQTGDTITLRSIKELPGKFRSVFAAHPYFNILQSIVLDRVIGSDSGIVVSAPTGCGKTGVFELAIVRMLMSAAGNGLHLCKAVYLAPIKALCDERHTDWSQRYHLLRADKNICEC